MTDHLHDAMRQVTERTRDPFVVPAAAPGRLRESVLAIVADVEAHPGRAAADVVAAGLRKRRFLTSAERRFVAETVYGLLRQKRRVGEALALASPGGRTEALRGELRPLAHYLIYLLLEAGLRPEEAAAELRRAAQGAPARSDPGLDFARAAAVDELAGRTSGQPGSAGVRLSMPDWIVEAAGRLLGPDEGERLLAAMNQRAPLCVRANRLRGGRDELARRLETEGVATRPTRLATDGLLCEARAPLFGLESFREGWFEIQDEGSQLVGELVAPPPGGRLVDACAGAGGKTLQLASLLGGRGRILALDPHDRRLEELRRRARRAGLSNLVARAIPATGPLPAEVEAWRGRADRVLCDVPCSGLGVLRRNPEARWRIEPADVTRLAAEQLAILHRFADLCAPGGRLIYATCSFLAEEDEEVVARFLAESPEFTRVSAREILGRERALAIGDGDTLRLFPHRQGSDGFFAAVLRRTR